MNNQPQTIPAGLTYDDARAVREWAERARDADVQDGTVAHAARVLLAVLPKRPTLADMTMEDRHACRWMQADVEGRDRRPVIVNPYWDDGTARAVWPHGFIEQIEWERITPRPDLPRLEWPAGDQGAAPEETPESEKEFMANIEKAMNDHYGPPALPAGWRIADHDVYGRVVVTNTTPNAAGNVYFVFPDATDEKGHYWHLCAPDKLTYTDTEPEEA